MLVLLSSKVEGATDRHQDVDEKRTDRNGPDLPGIAKGSQFISFRQRTVDLAVADVGGGDVVGSLGVAEEEVRLYFRQRAPLGRGEVADLEQEEDGELVLEGDRVQVARAICGVWLTF